VFAFPGKVDVAAGTELQSLRTDGEHPTAAQEMFTQEEHDLNVDEHEHCLEVGPLDVLQQTLDDPRTQQT